MKTRQLKPFEVSDRYPAPINPFHQDYVHCGGYVGNNIAVMEGNKDKEGNVHYLVIINRVTGERTMVIINPEPFQLVKSFFHLIRSIFTPSSSSLYEKICWFVRTELNWHPWLDSFWDYRRFWQISVDKFLQK